MSNEYGGRKYKYPSEVQVPQSNTGFLMDSNSASKYAFALPFVYSVLKDTNYLCPCPLSIIYSDASHAASVGHSLFSILFYLYLLALFYLFCPICCTVGGAWL